MKKVYIIGIAVLVILLLAGFSCLGRKDVKDKTLVANAAVKKDTGPCAEVSVARVQQGPIFKAYTAMGTLASKDMARLMPKVMGRIARIYVSEGDHVQPGQVLMQISPAEYQWAHQNAAALAQAARVAMEKGRRDFARAESLHKESAISEQNYQDTRSQFEAMRYQYQQAQSGESTARRSLQECRVTAPIAGVVTYKFGNEGELTGPQAPQPVFVIEQMGRVKLEVDLPEDAYGNLTVGNQSVVTVDAIPNQTFTGTIAKIYPSINPISKTFKVEIGLENPDLLLRSGMTARAKVIQQQREDCLYVPKNAVIPGEEGYYVYKVRGTTVYKTRVQAGIEGDENMEIVAGVAPGDRLVIAGQTGLKDGMRVNVKDEVVPLPAIPRPTAAKAAATTKTSNPSQG